MWKLLLDAVDGLIRLILPTLKRPRSKRGVLLVSSGGLGDTLLFAVIAGRFAKLTQDGGEPVIILVRRDTLPITFLYPPGIVIKSVEYRRFLRNLFYRVKTCLDLYKANYRIAVSTDHLRHPLIDDVLVSACGADESLAMSPRTWPKYDRLLERNRRLYTRLFEVPAGKAHRMVRWVDLANWATGSQEPVPVVRLPREWLPKGVELDHPTVLLHPFSAIRKRQYGISVFRKIIEALPGGYRAVLSAGPSDLDRNPEYRALLDLPGVTLDESSFEKKAALVQGVRLVVACDTSLMHLAVAAGTRTLCLASAAHVVDSIPYDDRMTPPNVEFLYHPMPCAGCLGQCSLPAEDGRYPCIARLDTALILDRLASALGGGEMNPPDRR